MRQPCCRPSGEISALPDKGDVMWNLNRNHMLDKLRRGETTLHFKCKQNCPCGRRLADGGNSDSCFTMLLFPEYSCFANENLFEMIQVGDREFLAEFNEICAVPGIDAAFFGPGDFCLSIGVSGESGHPEVKQASKFVAAAARRHGQSCKALERGLSFHQSRSGCVIFVEQCCKIVENDPEVFHEYDPATAG